MASHGLQLHQGSRGILNQSIMDFICNKLPLVVLHLNRVAKDFLFLFESVRYFLASVTSTIVPRYPATAPVASSMAVAETTNPTITFFLIEKPKFCDEVAAMKCSILPLLNDSLPIFGVHKSSPTVAQRSSALAPVIAHQASLTNRAPTLVVSLKNADWSICRQFAESFLGLAQCLLRLAFAR